MTQSQLATRLELVRGHWALGEHDLALLCLERAVVEAPGEPELRNVILSLGAEAPPAVVEQLRELHLRLVPAEGDEATAGEGHLGLPVLDDGDFVGRIPGVDAFSPPTPSEATPAPGLDGPHDAELPPVSTSTLAELLADQGEYAQALQVAEDVLGRNPHDLRARAVRDRLGRPGEDRQASIAALERWLHRIEKRRFRRVTSELTR